MRPDRENVRRWSSRHRPPRDASAAARREVATTVTDRPKPSAPKSSSRELAHLSPTFPHQRQHGDVACGVPREHGRAVSICPHRSRQTVPAAGPVRAVVKQFSTVTPRSIGAPQPRPRRWAAGGGARTARARVPPPSGPSPSSGCPSGSITRPRPRVVGRERAPAPSPRRFLLPRLLSPSFQRRSPAPRRKAPREAIRHSCRRPRPATAAAQLGAAVFAPPIRNLLCQPRRPLPRGQTPKRPALRWSPLERARGQRQHAQFSPVTSFHVRSNERQKFISSQI